MRQKLAVEDKLTHRILVFQKKGGEGSVSKILLSAQSGLGKQEQCASVSSPGANDSLLQFTPIESEYWTGAGNKGGVKQKFKCIFINQVVVLEQDLCGFKQIV